MLNSKVLIEKFLDLFNKLLFQDGVNNDVENFRESLLKLGSKAEPGFVFHITLAYRFNENEAKTSEELAREIVDVQKEWETYLKGKDNGSVKLKRPVLCYFPDMTEFFPL